MGKRATAVGKRASAVGKRASTVGKRASTVGKRVSTVGKRVSEYRFFRRDVFKTDRIPHIRPKLDIHLLADSFSDCDVIVAGLVKT